MTDKIEEEIKPCITDGILSVALFRLRTEPKDRWKEILNEKYYTEKDFKKQRQETLAEELEFLEMLDKDNAISLNKDYNYKVKQRIIKLKQKLGELK